MTKKRNIYLFDGVFVSIGLGSKEGLTQRLPFKLKDLALGFPLYFLACLLSMDK